MRRCVFYILQGVVGKWILSKSLLMTSPSCNFELIDNIAEIFGSVMGIIL
jgi:hypothetical protein